MAAWSFIDDPNLLVFVCNRVRSGAPVTDVYHDHNGDWQFLCGGDEHNDVEQLRQSHLKHVIAMDQTLVDRANLLRGQRAQRTAVGREWKVTRLRLDSDAAETPSPQHAPDCLCCTDTAGAVHDGSGLLPHERRVLDHIEKFGWHIWQVSSGATDAGFSYSVGMIKTLGVPDIIVFGQKTKWQGDMINFIGGEIRSGKRFELDRPVEGLIPNYKCIFKPVDSLQAFLYYATWVEWYHTKVLKDDLPPPHLVQLVWPDMKGRFPWDDGWDGGYLQPVLW